MGKDRALPQGDRAVVNGAASVSAVPASIPSADDYYVRLIEDKPIRGMWHCGPNAAWVEVTHLPTMISARAFDGAHHRAKQAAMACCQMMVEQSRLTKCQFPEKLSQPLPERLAQAIEARRAETGTGSVHESAVGPADAP